MKENSKLVLYCVCCNIPENWFIYLTYLSIVWFLSFSNFDQIGRDNDTSNPYMNIQLLK